MCRCAGVHSLWGDSLFSPSWISICLDPGAKLTFLWRTRPSLRILQLSCSSISLYMFSALFDFSLLSLSAHCRYDPIGPIPHSLCLQHGLSRRHAQPRSYQFTDGGRHWRPSPRQPDQTANHGGVLLKHPEPSHHFTWAHSCVALLHLRPLSVPFGVFSPHSGFLSFFVYLFPCGQRTSIQKTKAGLMKGCIVWCLVIHVFNILEYFSTAWTHTNFFCWCFYLDLDWRTLLLHFFLCICVILPRFIFTLDMLLVCIFSWWLLYIERSEGILVCSRRVFVPSLALSKVFLPMCLL